MLLVLIHKRDSFLYTSRPENLHVWVIHSLTTLWGGISHKDLCQPYYSLYCEEMIACSFNILSTIFVSVSMARSHFE